MLTALFLDDDYERHRLLQQYFAGAPLRFDRVFTAEAAIEALRARPYDLVFQDHDLGGCQMVPSEGGEATGYTVAKWMSEAQPQVGHVIIHSFNPGGARNMEQVLRRADYSVERLPFCDFTAARDWVSFLKEVNSG